MNISLPVILRLGEESSMIPAGGRAAGFFAALPMNSWFVILNEVKNPARCPPALALLDPSPATAGSG